MISVCIPTYNGEKYLKKQLDSILMQLGENDEIIISDDSSTDRTLEIIEDYHDKRIRLLRNNKFSSPTFNIENALKKAKGDFIFLADQDDVWMTDKVEISLNEIAGYDVLVSDCILINEHDQKIADSFYSINNSGRGFIKNFIKNSYLGCCMLVTRDILDFALPFPKRIAMHDIWIGLISEAVGKPKFIKNKLVMYRRHGDNLSSSSEKSEFSIHFKIKYRIMFLYYLAGRVMARVKNNK